VILPSRGAAEIQRGRHTSRIAPSAMPADSSSAPLLRTLPARCRDALRKSIFAVPLHREDDRGWYRRSVGDGRKRRRGCLARACSQGRGSLHGRRTGSQSWRNIGHRRLLRKITPRRHAFEPSRAEPPRITRYETTTAIARYPLLLLARLLAGTSQLARSQIVQPPCSCMCGVLNAELPIKALLAL
jgi:hypothetical protein